MNLVVLAAASLMLSLNALGAYVDPRLQQNSKEQRDQAVRVIVVFNTTTHKMQSEALAQERETLRSLKSVVAFQHPTSLWSVNSVAISLKTSDVETLAKQPQVSAIYANGLKRVVPQQSISTKSLNREDQYTYGLRKIGVDDVRLQAPDLIGTAQVVGVLDSGIDGKHPEFKDKIVGWFDLVNNRTEPYDDNQHGTHVSGTIVGAGSSIDLNFGVAPAAKLMVYKAFDQNGSVTDEKLLAAMQFIMDPDQDPSTHDFPSIVNNSWVGDPHDVTQNSFDNPYCRMVAAWEQKGILGVFAGGNAGPGASSVAAPAACPNVLSVGAINRNDISRRSSAQGPGLWKDVQVLKPDITAPGDLTFSTLPKGQYGTLSGTSMAAPHVSGMLAILKQVAPQLSLPQMIKCLISSSRDLGSAGADNVYGHGQPQLMNLILLASTGQCSSAILN